VEVRVAEPTPEELQTIKLKIEAGVNLTKEEKAIWKNNSKEEKAARAKLSFGQKLLLSAKSDFAQLMGKDDVDRYPIRDWLDTGNALFNAQISADPDRGMPSGRILQLAGIESSGKTYLSIEIAKNAQAVGYFVVLYDSEFDKNDRQALAERGINLEKLLYIPVDTVENCKTSVLNILDEIKDERVIILIDSIGNLSTTKEVEDSEAGSSTKDMSRPAQLKALFRTCTLRAGLKNVPMIIVNHVYASMSMYSPGNVIGGGSGSKYNSSIIIEFGRSQQKAEDKTVIGTIVTSTATKCRTAKEKTKVKFTIDFECGLKRYSGLDLFCADEGIIVKEGTKGKCYKLNPVKTNNLMLSIGEKFALKEMDDAFWAELLERFLGDYLRKHFKYQGLDEMSLDMEDEVAPDAGPAFHAFQEAEVEESVDE
jgi:RecA/RadA recombinase